jgi:polyadenylate-binding protein
MLNKETSKSKCYGYLNFYTEEDALRCLKEMNNAVLSQKQIVLSQKKNKDFDSKANVLLKNISKDITQSDLYKLSEDFGNIVSCKLEVNKDGSSKGYGYVQYDS